MSKFKKLLLIVSLALLLLVSVGVVYMLFIRENEPSKITGETIQIEMHKDIKSGVEFYLPLGYKNVKVEPEPAQKNLSESKSSVLMQLEKLSPQSFVIVQHDTGLSGPAALLRQSTLEYVETTIRQFYPVRYGSSYKSESLQRTKVSDHDAVEHIYTYTDKDGKPNKVRLLVVIWSDDETYNVILQSSESNFETIRNDLDSIKTTFKGSE